jgi:spermidine/putrescine-binding protein
MLKKTVLGIATAAAFAAAALVPTAASAHWHHHHHGWWGLYTGPAFYYPAYYGYGAGCYVGKRWVWTPGGWALARRPICY